MANVPCVKFHVRLDNRVRDVLPLKSKIVIKKANNKIKTNMKRRSMLPMSFHFYYCCCSAK